MNLTLSQLECFVATLEAGSFTGAAETLGVSQPAVAEQIQRLEGAVGRSLFARQVRGVRPTPAALELEPDARRALDGARAVSSMASTANTIGAGSVAFGTFGSPHHYGLAEVVRRFLADHPGSRLRIVGHNSSSTADDVRSGALDAAVVALPVDAAGLEVRPLFVGEVVYVSADRGHTRRPVSIETMASRSFILYVILGRHRRSDPAPAGRTRPGRRRPTPAEGRSGVRGHGARTRGRRHGRHVRAADPAAFARSSSEHGELRTPLADTFALVVRAGSRLSVPVQDVVDRVTANLLDRIEATGEP